MISFMPSFESQFTALERAVLQAICESYPADRLALEAQLSTAKLEKRENTGCGFFTHFLVDQSSSKRVGGERLRNGPQAKIEGLKYGMGFILWLESGYADCLEGYAYGPDSTTELPFESVHFQILSTDA
jgi:hypothetical protein